MPEWKRGDTFLSCLGTSHLTEDSLIIYLFFIKNISLLELPFFFKKKGKRVFLKLCCCAVVLFLLFRSMSLSKRD